ncbi:hypothetical protein Gohar_008745 [Gossypium harknessii]|uniref:Uncharacterized protein n=1 Tax=Gossypium harknessii TaxID=34285 RepID=A0A7J9GKN7_9ROSI|nr:hypothetical protein [Gossypium harknessii]
MWKLRLGPSTWDLGSYRVCFFARIKIVQVKTVHTCNTRADPVRVLI